MARIRTIKPEFFKHEELFELEQETGLPVRLAFIGLWTVCDREGRFKWRPRQIKTDVMPYDACDFSDVLEALRSSGMVVRYEIGGALYGCVPSFLSHQAINQREAQSVLPCPTDDACEKGNAHARASTGMARVSANIPTPIREAVFSRDGHKCVRCGSVDSLTIDHIFPRSIGGTHAESNLRTLCKSCNSGRPVGGQALIDDLFSDGLTMDDMAVTCSNVHARADTWGKEGKGKEGKGRSRGASSDATTTGDLLGDSSAKQQRATRLSADWSLPDDWREWSASNTQLTSHQIAIEADKFRDYWTAQPGAKATKTDWQATWRNWCRSARPVNGTAKPSRHNISQIDYGPGGVHDL